MRSIIIFLFAVLTINSIQAQEGVPKEKRLLGSLNFKNNEVFKRFGAFASANALYYHSNLGIGFDCFLVKNFSANIEIAVGETYGHEKPVYIQQLDSYISLKYFNSKASIGLKYWPITKKTNNNIYPNFGLNFSLTEVQFNTLGINNLWDLYLLRSKVIETPIGLCYYRDGFQVAAYVGAFMEGKWGLKNLTVSDIYPFISFQVGYRF